MPTTGHYFITIKILPIIATGGAAATMLMPQRTTTASGATAACHAVPLKAPLSVILYHQNVSPFILGQLIGSPPLFSLPTQKHFHTVPHRTCPHASFAHCRNITDVQYCCSIATTIEIPKTDTSHGYRRACRIRFRIGINFLDNTPGLLNYNERFIDIYHASRRRIPPAG
jgi:hypothetical protein